MIAEYLSSRCDSRMYNNEYLCECEESINLNFSSCLKEAIELDETVEQGKCRKQCGNRRKE